MHRLSVRTLLLALAVMLVPAHGLAAPRDAAANQKIEEALNLYLGTEFDKAEALLKGILEACEDRCSPGVKARAWMYVGIVRGSGKQDVAGAQESFQQAIAIDPNVKLDDALATPSVRDAFAAAAAALGQAAPAAAAAAKPAALAAGGEVPGNMECTPDVAEVESQRPIPVACTTDEPAVKVMLRYMPFGGEQWAQVQMVKKGETWQGEIPCADTGTTGRLKFYVQAKDKDGEELDNYGMKKQPAQINIVAKSDEEPPSYPGQPPPQRCISAAECPEDMIGTPACPGSPGKSGRGNKGWGAPCDTSHECDSGLLCMQGDSGRTCETAPSCDADADCPSGAVCKSGTCDVGDDDGEAAAGPYQKWWAGLHFVADFPFLSGEDVCARGADFDCFYGNGQTANNVSENFGGDLNGGASLGTMRLLLSFERLFTQRLGAEFRGGFAFNGGPQPQNGAAFLPVHLELRGKFWVLKNSFSRKGLRPYLTLGAGMAQVDGKLTVRVVDCSLQRQDPAAYASCNTRGTPGAQLELDAWRKLGQVFIGFGAGAMYAIAKNHGPVLNIGFMYTLPASGLVLSPSLGYHYGF